MKTKKEETIKLPAPMINEIEKYGDPRSIIIKATQDHLNEKRTETRLRINDQGQIRLPKDIMQKYNLHDNDRVLFINNGNGTISIRKA